MKVVLVGISPYSIESFAAHSHDAWEIVLNFEGKGTSVIGGQELDFYPGTIICQPPNVPHSKISTHKFKDIFIQISDFINPKNEEIPVFVDDEEKSFETLMFLALRIFHKKESNYTSILNSLSETMYQMLLSWSGENLRNESVELFKNELIENFIDPEFKISDAMKKTAYCSDYFRRCFKRSTGITPVEYLTNLRIEYAKKLLQQNGSNRLTISKIAASSGFYDPHYFSRLFKNKVGVSPQKYEKIHISTNQ